MGDNCIRIFEGVFRGMKVNLGEGEFSAYPYDCVWLGKKDYFLFQIERNMSYGDFPYEKKMSQMKFR